MSRETAKSSGLFGLLGDDTVQFINIDDTEELNRYLDLANLPDTPVYTGNTADGWGGGLDRYGSRMSTRDQELPLSNFFATSRENLADANSEADELCLLLAGFWSEINKPELLRNPADTPDDEDGNGNILEPKSWDDDDDDPIKRELLRRLPQFSFVLSVEAFVRDEDSSRAQDESKEQDESKV